MFTATKNATDNREFSNTNRRGSTLLNTAGTRVGGTKRHEKTETSAVRGCSWQRGQGRGEERKGGPFPFRLRLPLHPPSPSSPPPFPRASSFRRAFSTLHLLARAAHTVARSSPLCFRALQPGSVRALSGTPSRSVARARAHRSERPWPTSRSTLSRSSMQRRSRRPVFPPMPLPNRQGAIVRETTDRYAPRSRQKTQGRGTDRGDCDGGRGGGGGEVLRRLGAGGRACCVRPGGRDRLGLGV